MPQFERYSIVRWMKQADAAEMLSVQFHPQLRPTELTLAQLEGWILGLA